MLYKKFIVIEGIDGAGKGTVIDAVKDFLSKNKISFLDLRESSYYDIKNINLGSYEAILTCEPTNSAKGRDIRNRILKNISKYTARYVAEKFAEDRNLLYKLILIPVLKKGLFVFQDRSIVSSFVYQINQARKKNEKLLEDDIARMNALALRHLPGLVIVQQIDPETAKSRLLKRKSKVDTTEFEAINFLKCNSKEYGSGKWRKILQKGGSLVVDLDCNADVKTVKRNAIRIIINYCKRNKLDLFS